MNQEVLEQHGIILSQDVYSPRTGDIRIPEYVGVIIESLLDHNIRVDEFVQVAKLARIAKEYNAAKVSQETWVHFLGSYIFLGFDESLGRTSKRR